MNNLQLALSLRDRGIEQVSLNNASFLETMRGVARMICREKGEVTADDIREWAKQHSIEPTHKNCWGAIFKNGEFESKGFVRSKQVSGRGNWIMVWRLKSGDKHGL